MSDANTKDLIERTNAELTRLGLDHETYGASSPAVDAPDDYPAGWIKVHEEGYCYSGPAWAILRALESAEPGNPDDTDEFDDFAIRAMFDALESAEAIGNGIVEEDDPSSFGHEVWNDYHDFAGLEAAEGLGLIVIRTNAGLRYGYAPTDTDYSSCDSTHDYSPQFDTAQEATDAAQSFVAEEEARETTD